jgi:hypothetical protein
MSPQPEKLLHFLKEMGKIQIGPRYIYAVCGCGKSKGFLCKNRMGGAFLFCLPFNC